MVAVKVVVGVAMRAATRVVAVEGSLEVAAKAEEEQMVAATAAVQAVDREEAKAAA